MISQPVVHVVALHQHLRAKGWKPTDHKTKTGVFWEKDNLVVLIPNPLEDHYPDWMLADLVGIIGEIDAWRKNIK